MVEECSMTTAFVLGQNVNLSLEFHSGGNSAGFRDNLTFFDIRSVDTAEKRAYVIACHRFVKLFVEHFKTGDRGGLWFIDKTYNVRRIADVRNASFNSARSNGAAAGDGKYVFDGKKERLLVVAFRRRNVLVDGVHQFENALTFGSRKHVCIGSAARCFFKRFERGTFDDRNIVAGEFVRRKQISYFHFNEFQKFGIVKLIAFVQEHNDVRNAYLTSEQDVLTSLGHRTVGCRNNEDRAVHLSSARNHVLNVVGVSRAVNVCIVTAGRFVFYVRGVNCNSACFLFGCFIDFVVTHLLSLTFACHNHGDSSGQSGFTVVNVTDGTDVNVGLGSVEFCLCHF